MVMSSNHIFKPNRTKYILKIGSTITITPCTNRGFAKTLSVCKVGCGQGKAEAVVGWWWGVEGVKGL